MESQRPGRTALNTALPGLTASNEWLGGAVWGCCLGCALLILGWLGSGCELSVPLLVVGLYPCCGDCCSGATQLWRERLTFPDAPDFTKGNGHSKSNDCTPNLTMSILNRALGKSFLGLDGHYLSAQELGALERYARSYAVRLHVYEQLRDHSVVFVLQALNQQEQVYPELMQQHSKRCRYDMTEVLRYIALSVLRDDETFFKAQLLSWLQTILRAYGHTTHCATAYRFLQVVIAVTLPPEGVALTRPYFDLITKTLETHA